MRIVHLQHPTQRARTCCGKRSPWPNDEASVTISAVTCDACLDTRARMAAAVAFEARRRLEDLRDKKLAQGGGALFYSDALTEAEALISSASDWSEGDRMEWRRSAARWRYKYLGADGPDVSDMKQIGESPQ